MSVISLYDANFAHENRAVVRSIAHYGLPTQKKKDSSSEEFWL
jgi:hypothetical protein